MKNCRRGSRNCFVRRFSYLRWCGRNCRSVGGWRRSLRVHIRRKNRGEKCTGKNDFQKLLHFTKNRSDDTDGMIRKTNRVSKSRAECLIVKNFTSKFLKKFAM